MRYVEFPKVLYRNETDREPSKVVRDWDEQLEAEKDGWIDITPKEMQARPDPRGGYVGLSNREASDAVKPSASADPVAHVEAEEAPKRRGRPPKA